MLFDESGLLWLSNPVLAVLAASVAVGLILWCHRWLESGSAPRPRMAIRRRDRRSARRHATLLRPASARPMESIREIQVLPVTALRARRRSSAPPSAA